MGVIIGAGLMSTATDVIYTHKKFKRPAVEVWESEKAEDNLITRENASGPTEVSDNDLQKSRRSNIVLLESSLGTHNEKETNPLVTEASSNESKFSCALCGFVNGNKSVFKQHFCINNGNRKAEVCRFCRQSITLHSVCKSSICIASRGLHSVNNAVSDELLNTSKTAYTRGHSFSSSPVTYVVRKDLCFDNAKEKLSECIHTPIPAQNEKQIYKPKFRAQYSFSEEAVKETLHNQANKSELCAVRTRPPQEKISCASSISSTYHAHTASPLFTSPASPGASSLSPHSYNQTRQSVSALNIPNAKFDEFQSLQRGISSPCSGIWKGIKGIKSPSPELVNQHITNLIVQNQAIVETHNPLWSIKYRRQSSTSSLNDNDNGAKARRSSVGEYSKGYKGKIQSVLNISQNKLVENSDSSSLSRLPKLNHTPASFSRASKQNISVLLPTSSNESKVRTVDTHTHKFKVLHSDEINVSSLDESTSVMQSESLNLSNYSVSKNSNSLLSCQKCGSIFSSNEINEHVCKCISDPLPQSFNYDQDVALDLQKKQEKILECERSSSRESCFSEPIYKQDENEHKTMRGLSISPNLNLRNTSIIASPPIKRRKLSVNDFSTKEKSLCSSLFLKNGKVSGTHYGIKMLEDLNKPKSNSNHIFGGEVKICDGKEYKTLKIDSIKTETPSLDLCIASRRLNEETEGKEVLLPTSVVVTIAKCGLYSGGTMVKAENKSNYHNKNRHLNINENLCTVNKPTKTSLCLNDDSLFSISPVNNHPLLLQYPQIKSHAVSSVPSLTTTNVSQGGFSLHLLPPGITLHAKSNVSSPISLPISTTCHGVPSEQPNLKFKEGPDHYYPTIISIGDEKVPYVPGIPGPYSQTGLIFKCPANPVDSSFLPLKSWSSSIVHLNDHLKQPISAMSNIQSQIISQSHTSIGQGKIDNGEDCALRLLDKKDFKGQTMIPIINDRNEDSFGTRRHAQVLTLPNNERPVIIGPKNMEITVQSLSSDHSSSGKNGDKVTTINRDIKLPANDDEKTFLIPRQRPNTLVIKQQSFNPKSSLALIGSTLVSPDTPRPRKSCAQLLLDGSAYTYLNLKVSTKTFFCCIYRPQPMYVLQSTNPKLSMYSNWQIRKSEDPLNLSPSEAMSLHISGHYYNRCYTIAKPKVTQLIVTPSSYWTLRKNKNYSGKDVGNEINLCPNQLSDSKSINEKKNIQMGNAVDESEDKSKRVKIFEGGFKTNEDYIYVRGRGRGRYVCETCGIRCKKPSMLKKHIRTHTDLRPFACKHCSFSFKTKGNLTKHLKSKAHFKRCTEMGIIPVPITVDDSHINQEALQLQGILEAEQGKDNLLSNEEGDEEDEDEGDDDEADEDDEEDEEDEDDEDINMSTHDPSYSLNGESVSFSSYVSSVKCSYLNPTTQCENKGAPSPSVSLDKHFEESVDNSINNKPIDLSVKRPTVITGSDVYGNIENNFRPNVLKLNKRLSDGIFKYPNSSLPHVDNIAKSAPHIKEQMSEILSPVTDSSLLLQSIYNSTSSLEKHHFKSDVVKDGVSCGNMLHTYLREIAVQDSARKRYQYLNSGTKEYPSEQHEKLNIQLTSADYGLPVSCISMNTNTASINTISLSKSNGSSLLSCDVIVNSCGVVPITNTASTTNFNLPRNMDGMSNIEFSAVNADEVCTTTVPENIPSNVLSKSGNNSVKIGSLIVSSNSLTSSSTYIVASKAMVANNFSSMRSHSVKTTRSNSCASTMPTPPANLTVINSCEGDSKPAFIAPSGVIPSSSARMGSDDGKCKCSICQKEFGKQSQLRLHMNIHFIERPHRCDSCGVSFRTNGHLQKHKRSVSHFNKVNMNMTFGTPSTDNPRPFKCHDCKIAFRIHGHLAKHLRSKLHIMKLECLGKLPFGTYAEIERSGVNLNEIDTSDCENSLESLQAMASKLYEKEPAKLLAWQSQQLQQSQQIKAKEARQNRERSISNSSTNSEDYLLDEQDVAMNMKYNDEDESGEEEEFMEVSRGTPPSTELSSSNSSGGRELQSSPSPSSSLPSYEVGSGATEGLVGCPQCHQKFLDVKHFEFHYCNEHEKKNEN